MAKTYDTYKDSGIAWIGEIPGEWEVCRLKSQFKASKGLNITKENLKDEGYPVISYGQIHAKNNCGTRISQELIRFVSNSYIDSNPECLTNKGCFIFADTSEDIEGCGNAVYVNSGSIFAGYHTIILKPKFGTSNKYLAYLFLTDCWRSQIRASVSGIKVLSITQKIINTTSILLPPLSVQQSISSFLDTKCGEIDSLISIQEKMISELLAYKQSVITEAVTKGLDKKAKMKNSGVEWIGDIPEEWEVKPYKAIFYTEKGLNITKADLVEKGEPVLSYGQIHSKMNTGTKINDALLKYVPSSYIETNPECLVQKGCFLIADTSEDYEGCGNAIYVDKDMTLFAGYHTIVARPIHNNGDYKYLAYLFLTDIWRQQIRSRVSGIKVYSINQKIIRLTSVLLPPLPVQQAIATYLDEKTSQIDSLIALKQSKIESLKEYKKSIIYEYVTGKKRV